MYHRLPACSESPTSRFVGRAKLRLSRDRGCPGIFSKNLVPLDSWVKPRTSKLDRRFRFGRSLTLPKNLVTFCKCLNCRALKGPKLSAYATLLSGLACKLEKSSCRRTNNPGSIAPQNRARYRYRARARSPNAASKRHVTRTPHRKARARFRVTV
jgi:hypothetical protein